MTRLGDMLAQRAQRTSRKPQEIERICALPKVYYSGVSGEPTWVGARGSLELRPVQVAALLAIRDVSGGFLPIGVGHGKSWIAVLAATACDRELAIILAPSGTLSQLRETHRELSEHYDVRPAEFVSYAALSRPDGGDLLRRILADHGVTADRAVLVLDEAHKIRTPTAARTMRVVRFAVAHPELAIVAMSGTMTSRSIRDMGHLAEMALRENSPIPRERRDLDLWSRCLDVDGFPSARDWQGLKPLSDWGACGWEQLRGEQRQRFARGTFNLRLESAPGVVATRDASVDCSLYLATHDDAVTADEILELLEVVDQGDHPSGEPLVDDLETVRVKRQLALGFWYQWVWPNGVIDEVWLAARRAWGRYVRRELEANAREGYDSPSLVYAQCELEHRQGSRKAIHRAWAAWSLERHKPQPPTVARWVNWTLLECAMSWARANDGIVWYQSDAVARELQARGLPTYLAGDQVPRHRHACAMSIRAHGTGLNLQAWDRALVLEPPSSGSTWEQLLGRLHRQGQESDEVVWEVLTHLPVFESAMRTARRQAEYIQATSGQRQKLLMSSRLDVSPVFSGGRP